MANLLTTEMTTPTVVTEASVGTQPALSVNLLEVRKSLEPYIPPLILIFGVFGNVMIIVILYRMRATGTAMNIFFIALAVSDLCLLMFGVFTKWMEYTFKYYIYDHCLVCCKVGIWIVYTAGVLSPWLLVAMTVQRAASVVWPHRVRVMCTKQKSKIFTVIMSICIILLHAHVPYGYEVLEDWHGNNSVTDCRPGFLSYIIFMEDVWSLASLLLFSLLPFIPLAFCNVVLVWKLIASARNARTKLVSGGADRLAERQKKASSVTITLIFLSLAFLVLSSPFAVLIIYDAYVVPGREYMVDVNFQSVMWFLDFVTRMLWYSNSAVNFYLYILTGTKFREEFKQIMFGCFCRHAAQAKAGASTSSASTRTSSVSELSADQALEADEDF